MFLQAFRACTRLQMRDMPAAAWRNNERRGCVSNEKLPAHSVAMYCLKRQRVLYRARPLQTGARTGLFGWRVLVLLLDSAVVSLCKQLTACACYFVLSGPADTANVMQLKLRAWSAAHGRQGSVIPSRKWTRTLAAAFPPSKCVLFCEY